MQTLLYLYAQPMLLGNIHYILHGGLYLSILKILSSLRFIQHSNIVYAIKHFSVKYYMNGDELTLLSHTTKKNN